MRKRRKSQTVPEVHARLAPYFAFTTFSVAQSAVMTLGKLQTPDGGLPDVGPLEKIGRSIIDHAFLDNPEMFRRYGFRDFFEHVFGARRADATDTRLKTSRKAKELLCIAQQVRTGERKKVRSRDIESAMLFCIGLQNAIRQSGRPV